MNRYRLCDLSVGHTESFTLTLTQDMMDAFCAATGDVSPIHMSDAAAAARGHKGRVVYGMLCAGLFSTLAGVHLPGETCLLHSVNTKFAKPVYVGDVLTVTGTVQEINTTFSAITIKAHITNQAGEKVTKGVIQAGVEQASQP